MSDVYLATGKLGDIVNVLPILHQKWLTSGIPQKLMVAKDYAAIVEGLEYVEPVIYNGLFSDIDGAIRQVKKSGERAICLSVYGENFPFQKKHHSFAIDQWDRAGMAEKWGRIPLEMSFEDNAVPIYGGPHILFADHSQSSPFLQKEELFKMLVEAFPEHKVIRLSETKLKDPKRFTQLYNYADLLVTVETMHAHLSSAATCPVIQLATDKPTTWHGTAQRRGLAFHCRYGDFEFRKEELLRAAKSAVNKLRIPQPELFTTTFKHGYNMSVFRHGDNLLHAYRHHPDQKGWKTRIVIADSEGQTELQLPESFQDYSIEDARFFLHKDKLHLSVTISDAINHLFRSIQAYGQIEKSDGVWKMREVLVPKLDGNDWSGMQKNWSFFENHGRLHFIYGIVGKEQLVYSLDRDKIVQRFVSPAPFWKWGQIRGGVVIPYQGKLLRLFHSRVGDGHKHFNFRYYCGAAVMNPEPPFETLEVGKFPILAGNEEWVPNCKHWKPGCALTFGGYLDGDEIVASGGLNDTSCFKVRLKHGDLFL